MRENLFWDMTITANYYQYISTLSFYIAGFLVVGEGVENLKKLS